MKDTRIDKATKQVSGNPLLMSVFVGIALIIGVILGHSASSGPAVSEAAPVVDYSASGTPAIKPVETAPIEVVETPRNHETNDSLIVSDNSGTVMVGGTHNHFAAELDRTPAKIPQPVRRVIPIVVERMVPKEPKPVKIWTRPGIPAHSRLGRTLLTLKRFEDAGVRIFVEN